MTRPRIKSKIQCRQGLIMDNTDQVLTRGVEQVLPSKKGLAGLMAKKKITLYQGFDPSMPSLHLGNYVGLMKLRQFQKLGHKVIFLVGDFSGMIGDPTDKLAVRKKLSRKQVLSNCNNWKQQADKIINFGGNNPAEIKFNSKWLEKITFKELLEITSNFTVQQMIERGMFQERIKNNSPIYLHEFLYPIATAIDCVEMNVDLEIGGNDQLFNMMVGRTLMKAVKNKEKYVLTTKLLVDKEGKKAGKTTGNALFMDSSPEDFYGGIMSFPDETIYLGFELLTELPLSGLKEKIKQEPMAHKKILAFEVTKIIHGNTEAKKAQEYFEKTFQKRKPQYETRIPLSNNFLQTITPFVSNASVSSAKRFVAQGSVDINNKTITDPTHQLEIGDQIKIGTSTFGTVVEKE